MINPESAMVLRRGAGRDPGRRNAGDALLEAVGGAIGPDSPFGQFVFSRNGRLVGGGLATLAGIAAAAKQFNNPDPSRSDMQNLAAGIGSGLGTTGGAALGGIGGRVIGGALGAPLGPVGTAVGSTLGAIVLEPLGRGLFENIAGLLEPSQEDKALNQARRQAELALELDNKRAQTMLPMQVASAKATQAMRAQEQDKMLMAQLLQQAGASSASQQLAITQAMLGGGLS